MKLLSSIAILSLLVLLPVSVSAQVRVHVESTAKDSVGSRLTFAVKERIRRSSGLQLENQEEKALIHIKMVTLDPDEHGAGRGVRTIYSLVLTGKSLHETPVNVYLTNYVGFCGSARVDSCAEDLVARTDELATQVVTWIRNALDQE